MPRMTLDGAKKNLSSNVIQNTLKGMTFHQFYTKCKTRFTRTGVQFNATPRAKIFLHEGGGELTFFIKLYQIYTL